MDEQLIMPDNQYNEQLQQSYTKKKISSKKIFGLISGSIIALILIIVVLSKIISITDANNYNKKIVENIADIAKNEDCNKILCLVVDDGEEKYSKEFIPDELIAENPEDAAIVLRLVKSETEKGKYENGAKAYQRVYSIEWNDYRVDERLKYKSFYGGEPPYSTTSGDAYGSKPKTQEIKQWVSDTYNEIFDNPYITENVNGFNFVLPCSYEKDDEGNYINGDNFVEKVEYSKAEYGVYTMDEFSKAFLQMVKKMDGLYSVSDFKENNKGNIYTTYMMNVEKTKIVDKVINDSYTGVMTLYETENAFWAVNYRSPCGAFSSQEEIQAKFISLSELSYCD